MWVHLRALRVALVTTSNVFFFGFHLRVLRDRYEFEYWLDHLLPCCIRFFLSFNEFNMLSL